MSKRTAELQAKRAALVKRLTALNEEAGGDVMTDEAATEWEAASAQITAIDADITRLEALADLERKAPVVVHGNEIKGVTLRAERDKARGFTKPSEFLALVQANQQTGTRVNVSDERMQMLMLEGDGPGTFVLPAAFTPAPLRAPIQATVGSDEQSIADEGYGGALVESTYIPNLLQRQPEMDPTAGRTMRIPMSTPTVKIPARTDSTHTSSVSGGLTVGRRSELASFTASRMTLEKVVLDAHMLAGLNYESEELLAYSAPSFMAILQQGFGQEFPSKVFQEKLFGTGGDQYQGIVAAACTVALTRTVSSTISGRDVVNARARCWGYGNAIWLANQDVYPSLAAANIGIPSDTTPTNIINIYQPSLVPDRPDMLLGRPIFYTEYAETLGTKGDLILANFSEYLEGVLAPLQSAESIHVRFENHERTFKFWMMNAGAPWWRAALTPNQSSNTLSPFVVVAA